MTAYQPTNEWDELRVSKVSERLLDELELAPPPQASQDDLRRARRDAMRAMAVGVPKPRDFAEWVETAWPGAATALRNAYISKCQPYAGCLRVADDKYAPWLRANGLIGWVGSDAGDGFAVGSFGQEVRKFLRGEHPDQLGDA